LLGLIKFLSAAIVLKDQYITKN